MSNKRNTRRSRRKFPKIKNVNARQNILRDITRAANRNELRSAANEISSFGIKVPKYSAMQGFNSVGIHVKGVNLREAIKYTRRNYVKYKKANPYDRYEKTTTEGGVTMNANEFYRLQREQKMAISYTKRRMREIEQSETYVAGELQDPQSLANNETYKSLQVKLETLESTDLNKLSKYELDRKTATIRASLSESVRKKDQTFKDNMIDGLKEKAKQSGNRNLAYIANRISYMSTNEFRRLYNSDKAFRNLWDEWYANKDLKVDTMSEIWEEKIRTIAENFDEMEENVRI